MNEQPDVDFFRRYPRRAWGERIGPTTVRFHWECGHTEEKDFSKGPVHKRIPESAMGFMAGWWCKEKGGVGPACPKCFPQHQGPGRRRLPRRNH